MANQNNLVRATDTSFRILDSIQDLNEATITELSSHLGMPKSTVFNHLQTLAKRGVIVRDGDAYRLSFKFLDYGEHVRENTALYRQGRQRVDELAEETGEVANLMVPENHRGVYLYKAKGNHAVHHDTRPGKSIPLHCTALGKSILSCYDDETVREIVNETGLEAMTPETITDEELLLEELEEIRNRGFAVNRGERNERVHCVASPIEIKNVGVLGAISVSGPKTRMKETVLREGISEMILEASNVIEINLEHQ